MEVKVIVNEDGTTEIEVDGVVGSGCAQYTQAVIKALGGQVTKDEKKPEYYQTDSTKVRGGK